MTDVQEPSELARRCQIHAAKMDEEGHYVTANVLFLAANELSRLERTGSKVIRSQSISEDMAEMNAWCSAFHVACRTCEAFPPDANAQAHRFGAETVARAITRELDKRGIGVMWPDWMNYKGSGGEL